MIKKNDCLAVLLALAVTLPFLSWFRVAPLTDWVSDTTALVLLACSLPLILPAHDKSNLSVSLFCLPMCAFAVYLLLSSRQMDSAIACIVFILFLSVWSVLFSGHVRSVDRERFIHIIASLILVFALLQVALGMAQLFHLAPLLRGFVVYDPNAADSNIMGNIGQRNQYAQFLCWGIVSACYLHAVGKLRMPFFVLAVLFMAWLSACSGARLVWAYAFILAAVSVFWLVRRQSGVAVGMSRSALIAVIMMILLQLVSKQIAELLSVVGLTTHSVSGTERFFAAGFGVRRWIEWTKAIEIFTQHPWIGVGWGRFSAYSAELELTGGFPKSPESWLFIHCHNLFFQLLAETGLFGVLIIFIPTLLCLFSYVRSGQQSAENMLLLCIGLVAMTHSMFEYPLWYLPFLAMFVIVLLLAPLGRVNVSVRPSILRVTGLVVFVLAIGYVVNGVVNFRTLVMYNMPAGNPQENAQRLQSLFDMEKDPLWATDADFVLVNYLVASQSDLKLKLQHFERLAQFRPYPEVLLRLSMLYGLDRQAGKAEHALKLAIANYPDFSPNFSYRLSMMKEPELKILRNIADVAAKAYVQHGVQTPEGRTAAVMTVAAPVTRKALF